jgi:predicted amidohydrolase
MSSAGADLQGNLEKGEQCARLAATGGADVALFPEMWSMGYDIHRPDDWTRHAISVDSQFVEHFRKLARELDMAMVLGILEARPDGPRNSAVVIDRRGEISMTYSKVHTCYFGPEASCVPGDRASVVALDTDAGPVKVGVMICYDREFPETARLLMLEGADVILTPNACLLESTRLAQFRTRAFENQVGVAMTNYAYSTSQWDNAPNEHARFNGHSVAYSPIAFSETGQPLETEIVQGDETENVFFADFDVNAIHAYRKYGLWADAYRRPEMYAALAAPGACAQPSPPSPTYGES